MGNQPNNFIQCGVSQKDTRQQAHKTQQQAIKSNNWPQIFKKDNNQPKKLTQNRTNQNSIFAYSDQKSKSYLDRTSPSVNNPNFIPQHQNLTKVSRSPQNRYIRTLNSEFYEQDKGKCLDEIIQARYNSPMHFPEYQVINLLETCVYSLAYMSKKGVNNHDFYPTNIFYNNSIFKVLNPLVAKNSGYHLTHERKRFSFLSPQLILDILNDRQQSQIDKQIMDKSDIFSIGMILLQFCTLLPSSECYDSETYSIIDSQIKDRMQKVSQIYNPLIVNCLDLMLHYEVSKRISPIQLAYSLHSNLQTIRNQQAVQQSRIRLSATKVNQGPAPQQVLPPPPQPIYSQGIPHGSPNQIMQNYILPPPQIIQNQMKPHQGSNTQQQINPNMGQLLSQNQPGVIPQGINFNQNAQAPMVSSNNISSNSQVRNNPNIQMEPSNLMHANPPNNQPISRYITVPPNINNGTSINQIAPNLQTYHNSSPNLINDKPLYQASEQNKPLQVLQPKTTQISNPKQKFNPFQLIAEDFKQDQDSSPEKKTLGNGTRNTNITKQSSQSVVYPYTSTKTQNQSYVFKTINQSPITSYVYSNTAKKQQSLDQRVKRILQASKSIK